MRSSGFLSRRRAPDGASYVDDAAQLRGLLLFRKQIAARHRRESALRAEGEPLERNVARRFVDSAAQLVRRFERGALRADQSEHYWLAGSSRPQRRKVARALAVVLEKERVDGHFVE